MPCFAVGWSCFPCILFPGILTGEHFHSYMLHPEIWICNRFIRGWVVSSFSCFSIFHIRMICYHFFHVLLFPDLFLNLKTKAALYLTQLQPKPIRDSVCSIIGIRLALGMISMDVSKQMNDSKTLEMPFQCQCRVKSTWKVNMPIILKICIGT